MNITDSVGILVMTESQSHCPMKVSQAVIVGIDEVKGQGPLDGTASMSWWSPYQTGPVTTKGSQCFTHLRSDLCCNC